MFVVTSKTVIQRAKQSPERPQGWVVGVAEVASSDLVQRYRKGSEFWSINNCAGAKRCKASNGLGLSTSAVLSYVGSKPYRETE